MEKKTAKRLSQMLNKVTAHRAAVEYIDLRSRTIHPKGEFDRGGRFYLANKQSCCIGIRTPSAAYPFSQLLHRRSADHVAEEHGVEAADVRFIARLIDGQPEYRDPGYFNGVNDARNAADAIDRLLAKAVHRQVEAVSAGDPETYPGAEAQVPIPLDRALEPM